MNKNNKNNSKRNKKIYSNKDDISGNKIIIYKPLHKFINQNFNTNRNVNKKFEEIFKKIDKSIVTYKKNNLKVTPYNKIIMNNRHKNNKSENNSKNQLIKSIDRYHKNYSNLRNNVYYKKYHTDHKKNIDDFVQRINKRYYDLHYNTLTNNRRPVLPPVSKSLNIQKTKININVEINTLQDIIQLTKDYPDIYSYEYNIDMLSIHNIKFDLIKLNDMIGMQNLKKNIVDQILYFIQKLHVSDHKEHRDFLHTVIYGPPGTGKTETAKIIGNIYSKLGILKNKTFKKVTRSDLIAGYLGQTAIKTTQIIKDALGGVLFIDEAYSLGNTEKRDIFAKECIDTLCEALSDHKDNLMVIIAGYKEDLKKCFFSYNQGLDSRFTWRFNIDDYSYEELFLIFKKKVYECGWSLKDNIKDEWFQDKMQYFKYFGRDIETMLSKIKIAHSKRVFCLDDTHKKIINKKDMKNGFEMFISNEEVKNRKNNERELLQHMYC